MNRIIKKVAVLGSGVMGSRIACHFAGIGLPTLLLDIAPKELTPAETATLAEGNARYRARGDHSGGGAAPSGRPTAQFNRAAALFRGKHVSRSAKKTSQNKSPFRIRQYATASVTGP